MDDKLHLLKYFPLTSVADEPKPPTTKTTFTSIAADDSLKTTSPSPYIYSYDDSVWANSKTGRQILKYFASVNDASTWKVVLSITTAAELEVVANAEVARELLEEVDGISLDQNLCSSSWDRCIAVYQQLRHTHPSLTWLVPSQFAESFSRTPSNGSSPITGIWAPQSAKDLPPPLFAEDTNTPLVLSSREFIRINSQNASAEIALLLHHGVSRLQQCEAAGWDETTPLTVFFELAATPDIFMQVAKQRSLIILWELIIQVLGLKSEVIHTGIAAYCSGSNAHGEPHKALLASICESIGAIMGSATHIVIAGTDDSTPEATARSLRLARNIQFIARYESRIGDIVDPLGGSWYAEELTRSLMESSWEIFQHSQRDQAR